MMKKLLSSLCLMATLLFAMPQHALADDDVTITWDFQVDLVVEQTFEGTTGTLNSNTEGYALSIDATNGKFYVRGNDAQINKGTKISVPVKNAGDLVEITNNSTYGIQCTIGSANEEFTDKANTYSYYAKAADAAAGSVTITVTGNGYITAIKAVHYSQIKEQSLYYTNFSDWTEQKANTEAPIEVTAKAKYINQEFTFSIFNSMITPTNQNVGKFPTWEGGYIMASKAADPYITTSALPSITRVVFQHGATGSNRGWKLEAKGDGDDDWVVISNEMTNYMNIVEKDVNKTNCQLRFTNLNSAQNAYLFELEIFGNVDMTNMPLLDSFTLNGKTFVADDYCEMGDNEAYEATIKIASEATMISSENPLANITAQSGSEVNTDNIKYENTTAPDACKVTIPVTKNGASVNYIINVVRKPNYTLTYYNTDGKQFDILHSVEEDKTIAHFAVDSADVTVAEGYAFRGWFVEENGEKYTTDYVVTEDIALYAFQSPIEEATADAVYTYDLRDRYFYPEDHECIDYTTTGSFNGTQHGWNFKPGDVIKIHVGGTAKIIISQCAYSKGTIAVTKTDGTEVQAATAAAVTTDGDMQTIQYTGSEDWLTLNIAGGDVYIHRIIVINEGNGELRQDNWFFCNPGSADSFIAALTLANADATSDRLYIFLPNGTYDLGSACLTQISRNNISIIGESTDGVVICNLPKAEGIGVTATLYNTSDGLYMQDLTLKNNWDYDGSTGRAVCLQDKGSNTICKNVKLLSYQDTYYSNKASNFYWEDSEIHGVVDYLCGDGDVVYNRCAFVNEQRSTATIAAPYTDANCLWGYVFLNCTIENNATSFNLGRSWGGNSKLAYINTVFKGNASSQIISSRFTTAGMNVAAYAFYEYNSVNEEGTVVSPKSNVQTFTHSSGNNADFETILAAEDAAKYTVDNIYGDWAPDDACVQLTAPTVTLEAGVATWTAVEGAQAYAIYEDGELTTVVDAETLTMTTTATTVQVRAANAMGGFCPLATAEEGDNPISSIAADELNNDNAAYYNVLGQRVNANARGIVITNNKKFLVK